MEVPEVAGNADFAYVEPGTFEMGSPITEWIVVLKKDNTPLVYVHSHFTYRGHTKPL